jgi:uncharacterized protein with HEPN domain
MRASKWDSNLRSIRQHLIRLRRFAVEANSEVREAKVAAEDAVATSLKLIAEASRMLAGKYRGR